MAEAPKNKTNPMLDALADDLDAMLSDDQGADAVELLADDDAIERLLMAESLVSDADEVVDNRAEAAESMVDAADDDFNDVVLDSVESPEKADWGIDDEALLAAVDGDEADDARLVEPIETFDTPELQALERVEALDDLVEDAPVVASEPAAPIEADAGMDAFAAALLADEDEALDIEAVDFAPASEKAAPLLLDEDDLLFDSAPEASAVATAVESAVEPTPVAASTPVAEAPMVMPAPAVDYSGDIAELLAQITALKKHQQALKQEISDKAAKEQLAGFVEDIGHLQSEQKKSRRAVEAVNSRKPVTAYVASGLAALALLAAIGLAFQGAITNTQIEEMAKMVVKLQQEAGGVPADQAAEKEVIQKQLDELAVASGVSAGQIAELQKAQQAQAGAAPTDDVAKQLQALNNQSMQMGAAIEALQDKLNALEKGHAVAAVKPEKKKPEPVAENWVVNLIAYKQDWYAQRKADEFAAKGISAKVVKAEIKGESWYRLVVDGFSSQYDAANYAAKTKKTLNLDSVWLSRNKD